ncbi:hypothetical protein [Reyranella sp.]|uniref:hypothetical protein n=1 Tax=Reyranella sp. TaxID=1929291 RepID=UPI003782DBCE
MKKHDLELKTRQMQLERLRQLQSSVDRAMATVGARRARELTNVIEDLVAPCLVLIVDAAASKLHNIQEDPGSDALEVDLDFRQNPYEKFRRAIKEVTLAECLPRACLEKRWYDYLLFKYLADVVASYRGILVDISYQEGVGSTVVKLDVRRTAIDDRMKRLGVRFYTCRTRHALEAKDLAVLGVPKYVDRDRSRAVDSSEGSARSFYEETYRKLIARRLVPLQTLREYDPALVKALYKSCEKAGAPPRHWLPESRSELAAYNLNGIGQTVRSAVQAFVTKKWRAGHSNPT